MAALVICALVFLVTSGAVVLLIASRGGDAARTRTRVRELGVAPRQEDRGSLSDFVLATLPAMGNQLLPKNEQARGMLQQRLVQAGFYSRTALPLFVAVKALLCLACVGGGVAIVLSGVLSSTWAAVAAGALACLGFVAPGLWLDSRKKKRLALLRRGLADFLDMLVLCVEGGVSVNQGLLRVNGELYDSHPLLAAELNIVQREMLLGLSMGEALRKLADRVDLDELRTLSAILLQSERYGSSIAKTLRIHADTMRLQRQQRAAESAQAAAVKVLFPTLLFIFPAIFIVILGPAALQISHVFSQMKH